MTLTMRPAACLITSPCGFKGVSSGHVQNRAVADALGSALSGLAIAVLLAWSPMASSQPQRPLALASEPVTANGPAWFQLTLPQKQVLAPLATDWDTGMSEPQKRKWLEISKNYGGLTPQAQATLNSRMNEWVALSPQQRAQARLNFGKTLELSGQLTPEEKKAKWEAYQALSPEEKQKLAATASPKPSGAATAIKPVAPQKLAVVPVPAASRQGFKPAPKISSLPAGTATSTLAPPVSASSAAAQQ